MATPNSDTSSTSAHSEALAIIPHRRRSAKFTPSQGQSVSSEADSVNSCSVAYTLYFSESLDKPRGKRSLVVEDFARTKESAARHPLEVSKRVKLFGGATSECGGDELDRIESVIDECIYIYSSGLPESRSRCG